MVEFRHFFKIPGKKHFVWFLWKWLKRYLANSSIHGIKYLVEDGRHWTERIFWLICCGLSWWGCIVMVSGVLTDFSSRPVATTVETNYLNWRAELPSIHVCYTSSERSDDYIIKTWKKSFSKTMTNVPAFGYVKEIYEPTDAAAFDAISKLIQVSCEETFEFCEWNNARLNCCDVFHPLWSLQGHCHSVNSIFARPPRNSAIVDESYFVRDPTSSGIFTIGLRIHKDSKNAAVYVLDRFSFPSITTGLEKALSTHWRVKTVKLDIVQAPTYNEEAVRAVQIDRRNCRYVDEIEDYVYFEQYSYDVCLAEKIMRNMLDNCGCVSHLYPRKDNVKVCDYEGLSCLTKIPSVIFSTANTTCLAHCEEIDFEFYARTEKSGRRGVISVHLMPGPTLRYRRYVVHSKLDVVVTVGGAIGLFVGASILSIVEIPYWLIIRGFDDDDDDEEIDQARREDDRKNSVTSRAS